MDDFVQWLYVNYILPHLEKIPQGDDALWLSSWENSLDPLQREDWEKARAFYASHAFFSPHRSGTVALDGALQLPVLLGLHVSLDIVLHQPDGPGVAHRHHVDGLAVLHRLHFGVLVEDVQQISLVIREV